MRPVRRLRFSPLGLYIAFLLVTASPAGAWDKGNLADYHDRRARLASQTGDGVIVLFGYHDEDVAASVTRFRQNENFYYLTGWNEPDAMLLLVAKSSGKGTHEQASELQKEILFIPPHDSRQEKWTGPRLGPDDRDARSRSGFPLVESTTRFPSELQEALKDSSRIYTELTPQPESGEDGF